MTRIVVFASGSGSNFQKIKESIDNNQINGKIVLLISNNPNCGAVKFSELNNIDFKIINDYRYNEKKNNQYELVLEKYRPNLILLAGFMKKIPHNIIRIYKNKIMNIHPSLLPKYGGKGYYGMNVHKSVVQNRERITGATVHFVDDNYDKGPIIIQEKVGVDSSDSPDIVSEKVLKIEHKIYSKAIKAFCLNKITIDKDSVIINE